MSINIGGLFLGIVLLILVLAVPPALLWGLIRSVQSKRMALSVVIGVVTIAVFGLYVRVAYAVAPLGDKLVSQIETDNGTMVVFQHCNFSVEPYTTRFYFKPHSGPWSCYYMDHEDIRWLNGRIEIDTALAVAHIYRGDSNAGSFDIKTLTFTRANGITTTNCWTLPSDLQPGDELKKEHRTR